MKISDKLLQKYAAPKVILPPAPEKEMDIKVPVEKSEIPREWVEFQEFDPLTEKPAQSQEELMQELANPTDVDVETPEYERELMKVLRPEFVQNKAAPDAATVPPPRKRANLSPDALVKLCTRYSDLAHKL